MKTKAFRGIYKMQGSRFYWYRWSDKGQRYAVSLETEDEAEAILKKRAILADVEARGSAHYKSKPDADTPATHFEAIIAEYLADGMSRERRPLSPGTAQTIKYVLKKFASDSGIKTLHDLKPDSMKVWLRAQKKDKSTETIRSYTRDFKTLRKYLLEKKLVRQLDPLDMPDAAPKGRTNWIEQAKIDEVIAAAFDDSDLKFTLHAGFDAGMRRAEIAEARCEWFDLKAGLLHVYSSDSFKTKDRDRRAIPLKNAFRDFLKTYLANRTEGYVLAPEVTKGKAKYRYDMNRRLMTHFRNCKIKSGWHDMRRSFASNLVSKGESIYIVAGWLGDGVAVVERSYGHLAPASGNINR